MSIENRKKLLDELDKYEIKINADREKRAEESAAKLVASAQKEAEEKLKAAKGKSSEGGVEITDAESESVKNFISGEKQKLEAMEINADKKKELIEKLADLEQKLDDQIAANAEKNENRKLEGKKAALSASQDLLQTGLEFIKQGYEEESNKYEIEKERQLSALQKQKDSGAITEKQYQEKKTKIENDAAIKQAKVKRKSAEMDKIIALSQIAQQTAVAVISAQKLLPPWSTIVSGIILATAALQTAMVIKQPLPEIPKFKEGTKAPLGKSTLAWVGDGNERELITHPDGSMMLSPDKATLAFLEKGSTVTPMHRLNKQMRGIEKGFTIINENKGWERVEKAINKMAENIPQQSTTFVNVTGENLRVTNRYRR